MFGYASAIETLKKNGNPTLPDDFVHALTFCAHASPLITEGLKGNPRQVKRFLNAFILRKKLAQVAKLANIVNRALKQSHFCAFERGQEGLPGEAGWALEKWTS